WFTNEVDVRLFDLSTHAIRLFCLAYIFRWIVVTTQSFFSAIGKPLQATILSVGTAFVFPVILLAALWGLGLDGIWLNFAGVNFLSAVCGIMMLYKLLKAI
ncbi:MAG: MATE family efflux transporter, partial [Firmicutes bacterium]|nr:MATE family efflux transporter [Bacillota bacterium]